jgi:hypothetical protein
MKGWGAQFFLSALLAVAVFLYFRHNREPEATPNAGSSEKTPAPAVAGGHSTPMAAENARAGGQFSTEAQAEISKCLGRPAESFTELRAQLEQEAPIKQNQLEWMLFHYDDSSGQPMRARLAREGLKDGRPDMRISLFTVDSEGLPDPAPLPPGLQTYTEEALRAFVADKRVTKELQNRTIRFENGAELRIQTENDEIDKLDFRKPGMRLACDGIAGPPACHCAR